MKAIVRVKVCGITNRSDAQAAVALGADALGFNLFAGSSRCIDLDREAAWMVALPPFVTKVAVLVNASLDESRRVAEHPAIDLVQLHGDEDAAYCAALAQSGRPFIKALRLRKAADFAQATHFSTGHVLIDAHVAGSYGGTGQVLDWELAAAFVREHPQLQVLLAGGLNPENVAQAVRAVRPFAVDVASGVERAPGQKDAGKMAALIAALR